MTTTDAVAETPHRFTRYSGDPADKDIFLLRFRMSSYSAGYFSFYDGTEAHAAVPNDPDEVAARPESTFAERAEKKALRAENKEHQKLCKQAYGFVLSSLDTATALAAQNEAPDQTDPRAAHDAMQRILISTTKESSPKCT